MYTRNGHIWEVLVPYVPSVPHRLNSQELAENVELIWLQMSLLVEENDLFQ